MTKDIQTYLLAGCGRCPLGGTPDCKVHTWKAEISLLRKIVSTTGLTEEMKWGGPCYTYNGKNVLMISALKKYANVSFFKGVLLKDEKNLLVKAGEHSQAARMFRFTHTDEIHAIEAEVKAYIFEAIEVERAGLKVEFKKEPEPIPTELEQKFKEDPLLEHAFFALTPGRQRGYIIYFTAPKQSKTRLSRIEKCTEKILNGEGLHDKYSGRKKEG